MKLIKKRMWAFLSAALAGAMFLPGTAPTVHAAGKPLKSRDFSP